ALLEDRQLWPVLVVIGRALLITAAQRLSDARMLKLCVKARQIGLSWITAYSLIRRKLSKGARLDAWVSSRDEVQAQLFLEDAKRFVAVFNAAADSLGQNVVDDEGHTAFTLRLANGLRIHSMSSNVDAQVPTFLVPMFTIFHLIALF